MDEMTKKRMKEIGLGEGIKNLEEGKCPTCSKKIVSGSFKDVESLEVWNDNGMCQECIDQLRKRYGGSIPKVVNATIVSPKELNTNEQKEASCIAEVSMRLVDVVHRALKADGIKTKGEGQCIVGIKRAEGSEEIQEISLKILFGEKGGSNGKRS